MENPRQAFRREVSNFRNFKHPLVSDLMVEDELISFKYTPEAPAGSPPCESIDVTLFVQDSPGETSVYIGSLSETKYNNRSLSDVVKQVLKTLAGLASASTPKNHPSGTPKPNPAPAVAAAAADSSDESSDDTVLSEDETDGGPTEANGGSLPVGAQMRDSTGALFSVNEELKYDIETFWSVYGKAALEVTVFEDEVVMLVDLCVDKVIGRDVMLAWDFDSKKRVYARLKTSSTYYRDSGLQKVTVQQGRDASEKFVPQFQLTNIINKFVSATWAKGSPPFQSPADHAFYGGDEAPRPPEGETASGMKPGEVRVSKNLLAMVEMGFGIAQAKKALKMSEEDLDTAIAICCDMKDDVDVSDVLTPELDRQMAAILDGSAVVVDDSPPRQRPPQRARKSYLVELVRYMHSRIPKLNEQCVICDNEHLLVQMLKPTVCSRELCCWSFQELGVAAGVTLFAGLQQEVVDLLVMFAKQAAQSPRRDHIFDPYPLVFDPADRKKKVFDPNSKDYAAVERLISSLPDSTVAVMDTKQSLVGTLGAISPYAYPLLCWIVSSNRSFFVKLPSSLAIPELDGEQFLMLSSPPEKEKVFRSLRKQHGSVFTFHGSPIENWHSIVRNGLRNASGTALQINGAAYGGGIYMSKYLQVAAGYTRGGACTVIAVCEVINKDINRPCDNIWTVANESHVTTRMLLIHRGIVGQGVTGDDVAPKIRNVMHHYGVSTD